MYILHAAAYNHLFFLFHWAGQTILSGNLPLHLHTYVRMYVCTYVRTFMRPHLYNMHVINFIYIRWLIILYIFILIIYVHPP